MFSAALASEVAASPWIDADSIPQDLIEGVITTFIGLMILFSIKPRLRIDLNPEETAKAKSDERPKALSGGGPVKQGPKRSENFRFRVTNTRLSKVIEVRARLLRIRRPGARTPIGLVDEELFELRGHWSPLRPSCIELLQARLARPGPGEAKTETGTEESGESTLEKLRAERKRDRRDRAHFTFRPIGEELETEVRDLDENDYILFQVIAKNSFTGFSRLTRKRFNKRELMAVLAARTGTGTPSSGSGGDPG